MAGVSHITEVIMIVVNTDYIDDKKLQMIGIAKGSTIQTKHIGRDFGASLKTLVGGELKGYTEMMNEARDIATERMIDDAVRLGADAVINVRYSTSAIMESAAEVMAYGTAVKIV